MRNKQVENIVFNAIIAAIYIAFTLLFAPFSYSTKLLFIELRISEILLVLTFYNKKYGPGLILGCFIANLLGSDLGPIDWVIGTFQTALSVFIYYLVKKLPLSNLKKVVIGSIINSIQCGLIIGAELTYVYCDLSNYLSFFILQFLGVFIGEIIILIVGIIIFEIAFKNKELKRILDIK